MDENRAHSAFAGGFFILVGPASVVGERLAFEEIHIVGRRLVDQHEQNFAAHVGALVVVPFIFGSFDSVTHIHDFSVYVGLRLLRLVVGDVVVERHEISRVPAETHQ